MLKSEISKKYKLVNLKLKNGIVNKQVNLLSYNYAKNFKGAQIAPLKFL